MFRWMNQVLFRAILSHLLVAMPPALGLGLLVVDAHREGLVVEAQRVHLSSAARIADMISAAVQARVTSLEETVRVLDAHDVPFEHRRLALRALVAASGIGAVGLYDDEGRRDSVIAVPGEDRDLPDTLPVSPRRRARVARFALTEENDASFALVIAWRRDERVLGFLVTPLAPSSIRAAAVSITENILGPEGRVTVVDSRLSPVVSIGPSSSSTAPFEGLTTATTAATVDNISAGFSKKYVDQGQPLLAGVVSVPSLGWLVAAARPEAIALSTVVRVRSQVGLLAVLTGFLAGVVALWLARFVTDPIVRLTRSVIDVANRGFRGRATGARGHELILLEDAFNDALHELNRFRRTLRSTTHLRLKIARFLPPTALHDVLTKEFRVLQTGRETTLTLLYLDLQPDESWQDVRKAEMVAVLIDVYEAACALVEEHAGRIDHFSGDSVIALFVSDEDSHHAEQAVTAALTILDATDAISTRHGQTAPVAIGVATGRAVLSEIEGGREVSVVGDLVQTVVDLQQEGPTGMVRVSPETYRLLTSSVAEHPRVEHAPAESEPYP